MGQVTIYLDDETERKARAAARAEGLSLSKWVAVRIEQPVRSEWPASVRALAGAWTDLPSAESIRKLRAKDIPRSRPQETIAGSAISLGGSARRFSATFPFPRK